VRFVGCLNSPAAQDNLKVYFSRAQRAANEVANWFVGLL